MPRNPFRTGFVIQLEQGDSRLEWASKIDLTPRDLAKHLREIADQIDPRPAPTTEVASADALDPARK